MKEHQIKSKTGYSLTLQKGQTIKVINVEGQQIADFIAYNMHDFMERLDPVATRDALQSTDIKEGGILYSNLYRPMLTLLKDTVGKHDLLSPACRPEMYKLLFNKEKPLENCYYILNKALSNYNVPAPRQHYPFNIFMNTVIDKVNQITVKTSLSSAGDYVELRAEMDLIIAISACPNEESAGNGYHSTAIKIEVYP
ncbi:urea carboxylase-associated family protein [Neobacillus sp. FSL H8-0543]|uniref:urea carboxylase-associated family protein n=1 Tax=Neobacillus sp. FSL H8-0543 TaxID=2954672 RepID=UPI0031588C70